MSVALTFDTYAYVKRLRDAGVPERQAEVQAEAMVSIIEDRLASKRDLAEVWASLARDMAQIRADLKRDLTEMEYRMTIKLGGLMMAAVTIVAAMVKLL